MTETGRAAGGRSEAGPAGAGGRPGEERIVVRDRRKIDPATAKPKSAGPRSGSADGTASVDTASVDTGETAPLIEDRPAEAAEPATSAEPVESPVPDGTAESTEVPEAAEVIEPAQAEAAEPTASTVEIDGMSVGEAEAATEAADEAATEAADEGAEATDLGAEVTALRTELAERTGDLQRVTAEYANYRRRVERDRALATEQGVASVLTTLLPILDDLDRAREHGDLVGPFGSVAEQLTLSLGKFGLTPFGAPGDPFDPTRHEAVAHLTSPEVTEPTCVEVLRRGYLMGDRLLRAALVAVADPE